MDLKFLLNDSFDQIIYPLECKGCSRGIMMKSTPPPLIKIKGGVGGCEGKGCEIDIPFHMWNMGLH